MSRSLFLTLALASLFATGCDERSPEVSAAAQQVDGSSRGRHRVRPSKTSSSRKPGSAVAVDVDIPTIDVALLDKEATAFEPGRDPFRFGRIEKPPVRRVPQPQKVRDPVPVDPEPAKPAVPMAPPFTRTYLGSFGPAGLRIAVFEDSEGTITNAFEGEVLENRFKVLKIGYESVDIEFVGFPDTPAERVPVGG